METTGEINTQVAAIEAELLQYKQIEFPLKHLFAPGVYVREITMPRGEHGTLVIGHEHKTEHFNIVLTGKAIVLCGEELHYITAPSVFVSKAGVRKVLIILEDMRWVTVHPTDETDLKKLEELLVVKTAAALSYEERKLLEDKGLLT